MCTYIFICIHMLQVHAQTSICMRMAANARTAVRPGGMHQSLPQSIFLCRSLSPPTLPSPFAPFSLSSSLSLVLSVCLSLSLSLSLARARSLCRVDDVPFGIFEASSEIRLCLPVLALASLHIQPPHVRVLLLVTEFLPVFPRPSVTADALSFSRAHACD